MPPFTPTALATALVDEVPLSLLDLLQQRLASLLGPRYTVVLAGSGNGSGVSQYHLAIQHNHSGLSLEDNGGVGPGFVERLLALGVRTKSMLESPTFTRMLDGNPEQLLTWISELPSDAQLQGNARQLQPASRQLVASR